MLSDERLDNQADELYIAVSNASMKFIALILLSAGGNAFSQLTKVHPGPFQPGFISLTRFDPSRPAVLEQPDKKHGRIIQLNLWFPATGIARKMSFADYVGLAGLELDSGRTHNRQKTGIDRYFQWPASLKADKKLFLRFLNKKQASSAGKNAAFKSRKCHLVMIVHGFAADHAFMAEYLASQGYVVLHIPVKGSDKYELDYENKGLEYQVLDYEFGWNVVKKEFPFMIMDVAVVGFSFGAQSAMALALKHKDIKAMVSLDGGIGSAFGANLVSKLNEYNKAKVTLPILHL